VGENTAVQLERKSLNGSLEMLLREERLCLVTSDFELFDGGEPK
jgi:hypothetical protein